MIEKILDAWMRVGDVVNNGYINLPYNWLLVIALPMYLIFVVLNIFVMLLLLIIYSVESMIKYDITLTESFNAFKEGVMEGIEELKEELKG